MQLLVGWLVGWLYSWLDSWLAGERGPNVGQASTVC